MSSEVTILDAASGWRGPWMRWPLTVLWFALFGLSLATATATAWFDVSGPDTLLEFGLRDTINGAIPFGPEAIQSGMRTGDKIVSVNGMPYGIAPPMPPVGGALEFKVVSPDGTRNEHRLTRSPANVERFYAGSGVTLEFSNWFAAVTSALGNAILIATAALLFRRGRHQLMPTMLSFAFLMLACTLMNFPLESWLGLALWRMRLLMPAWTLFILAILLFPDGRFAWRWTRWLAGILVVATGAIVWAPPEVWSPWSVVHTGFLVVAAGSLAFRYRTLAPGPQRQQVRWALSGFVAGSFVLVPILVVELAVLAADLPTPVIVWGSLADQALLVLELVLIAGGLLVSLVKYRLYDADAVISRSVSIGALTLTLLAVFAGTEKVIELLGEEYFGEKLGVLAGGLGAAFAAAMIVPLHHRLSHWAEHKFQKQLIRLKHGLPLLVGDMRETAPVQRIAAATLDSVSHGVRASRAALLFEGALLDARGIEPDEVERWRQGWTPPPHDGFDIDKTDPLLPLRVPLAADGHGRIGWLLLGPRPDGSFYGKDERETLAEIADPVARALEIASAREKRETEEAQRWRAQESLNAEIKSVNSELVRILGSLDQKLGALASFPPAAAAE